MRPFLFVNIAAAFTQLGILLGQAHAFPEVAWTGAGPDALWSTPGNWSPASSPSATDRVFLPGWADGTQNSKLDSDRTIASLNVELPTSGGGHTIDLAGKTLQITQGIELHSGSYGVRLENGTVRIGSAEQPASMRWGDRPNERDDGLGLSLGDYVQIEAVLSELVIADSAEVSTGQFTGGQWGSIEIGSALNRGTFVAGRSRLAGTYNGAHLEMQNQSNFTAVVDRFIVGESLQGDANGYVALAESSHIDAPEIVIGVGQRGGGALFLGITNTLNTDRIEVGTGAAHGTLQGRGGYGNLTTIGSAERPATLVVGQHSVNSTGTQQAVASFSEFQINAHLQNLIVGQNIGGSSGGVNAQFYGGNAGAISVGSRETPGNVLVGTSFAGGSEAQAFVYLADQPQFNAYVENFHVGVQEAGRAQGTLILAQNNVIEAKNIVVGGEWGLGSMTLRQQNTILADTITVGTGGYETPSLALFGGPVRGRINIEPGGTAQIGTPTQRPDLLVGKIETRFDPGIWPRGEVNFEGGNVTAYFDQITIGRGEEGYGVFTTGSSGLIEANQIVLGESSGSYGTINLVGGTLRVPKILRGEGNGSFNWTDGRLEVRELGMSLKNQWTYGTLVVNGPTSIDGNFDMAGGTIEFDLGRGGHLQVNGSVSVYSSVEILGSDGFEPVSGESYTLIERAGYESFSVSAHELYWNLGDYRLDFDWGAYLGEMKFAVRASRYGDANLDNLTDGADYTVWADHFLKRPYNGFLDGDFNRDGKVNGADYVVWADHYKVGPPNLAVSAVPEPSTWYLGWIAAGVFAAYSGIRRSGTTA